MFIEKENYNADEDLNYDFHFEDDPDSDLGEECEGSDILEKECKVLDEDTKFVVDYIKNSGSVLNAKSAMMKKYVYLLNRAIKVGHRYGDGTIETIKSDWAWYFEVLQGFLDDEKRKNVIKNMELLPQDIG